MEKLEIDGVIYHKRCFKCRECGTTLSARTYAKGNGNVYCKAHYTQLFQRKGNYHGGFE